MKVSTCLILRLFKIKSFLCQIEIEIEINFIQQIEIEINFIQQITGVQTRFMDDNPFRGF